MRILAGAAALALLSIVACGESARRGPAEVPGECSASAPDGSTCEPSSPPEPSCTPLTCADMEVECGTAREHRCGTMLACGECSGTETCSAFAGVCAPTLPTRSFAWAWRAPGQLGGLAGDPLSGDAYLLWHSSAEDAVALERVRKGTATPVRRYAVDGNTRDVFIAPMPNLHVRQDGTLYAGVRAVSGFGMWTTVDLGAGAREGVQVVQLDRRGEYLRTVLTCCGFFESVRWVEDVDERGNLIVFQRSTGPRWERLVRADGVEILLSEFSNSTLERGGILAEHGCAASRFTADGAIVCGGAGGSVTKLDLDGKVLWTTAIGAGESGTVRDIGVTARGTIVVVGSSTANFVAERSGYYAAIEPDGAVRFLRAVEPAPQALAVHPSGRAAMLLTPDPYLGAGADVLYANLDGELLWRRFVEGAKQVAFVGDEVVVAAYTARSAAEDGTGSSREVLVVGFGADPP